MRQHARAPLVVPHFAMRPRFSDALLVWLGTIRELNHGRPGRGGQHLMGFESKPPPGIRDRSHGRCRCTCRGAAGAPHGSGAAGSGVGRPGMLAIQGAGPVDLPACPARSGAQQPHGRLSLHSTCDFPRDITPHDQYRSGHCSSSHDRARARRGQQLTTPEEWFATVTLYTSYDRAFSA